MYCQVALIDLRKSSYQYFYIRVDDCIIVKMSVSEIMLFVVPVCRTIRPSQETSWRCCLVYNGKINKIFDFFEACACHMICHGSREELDTWASVNRTWPPLQQIHPCILRHVCTLDINQHFHTHYYVLYVLTEECGDERLKHSLKCLTFVLCVCLSVFIGWRVCCCSFVFACALLTLNVCITDWQVPQGNQ